MRSTVLFNLTSISNSITIVKITGWPLLPRKTVISCVLAVFLGEGTWAIFGVKVRP